MLIRLPNPRTSSTYSIKKNLFIHIGIQLHYTVGRRDLKKNMDTCHFIEDF